MYSHRHVLALLLSTLAASACSESPTGAARPPTGGPPETTLQGVIVSEPIESPDAGGASMVTYVSLPVGALPEARTVQVRNLTAGGAALPAIPVADGGFDPVALPASVDDRLELVFQDDAGQTRLEMATVPDRRAPVIVRTSPGNQTDVPLDIRPQVVFSEPIDPATLGSIQLSWNIAIDRIWLLPGLPWVAEVVPVIDLDPATTYELAVNHWTLRDLMGDVIGTNRTIGLERFTTAEAPSFDVDGGGRIAFVSTRDGAPHVYVIEPDGTGLTRLAFGEAPALSPDGRRVAFHTWPSGTRHEGLSEVHVMDANGSGERVLVAGGAVSPAWSPDGRRIAFGRDDGIFVVNADGSEEALLVTSEAVRATPGSDPWLTEPAWSPDGQRILFVGYGWEWSGVFVVDADGSHPTLLDVPATGLAWSPDGSRLAGNSGYGIRSVALDGSDARMHAYGFGRPDWSARGRYLVYERQGLEGIDCDGPAPCLARRIFVADIVEGRRRQLVPEAVGTASPFYEDYHPAWSRGRTVR